MEIVQGYLLSYGYIIVVFCMSLILEKKGIVKEEGSRKIIHILVCFTWLIMNHAFSNSIHSVVIPVSFVFVNYLIKKEQLIPGMYRENNDSYGTVFYAISLAVMNMIALTNDKFIIPSGIAIFALSFGDGFAAIFGGVENKYNVRTKQRKSVFGTAACLFFSFAGILILCACKNVDLPIPMMLLLACLSTLLEFVGGKYDNLLIPFGVFILSYLVL